MYVKSFLIHHYLEIRNSVIFNKSSEVLKIEGDDLKLNDQSTS